jgi:PAS domain S-box-containing protein
VVWSEKQYQLFGIDPKTKISYDTFMKSTHPDDRPAINQEFENSLKKRTDFNITFRVIWPNGSTHWIKSNGRAFFDERGKPLRMFGINVDLTELMQKK